MLQEAAGSESGIVFVEWQEVGVKESLKNIFFLLLPSKVSGRPPAWVVTSAKPPSRWTGGSLSGERNKASCWCREGAEVSGSGEQVPAKKGWERKESGEGELPFQSVSSLLGAAVGHSGGQSQQWECWDELRRGAKVADGKWPGT